MTFFPRNTKSPITVSISSSDGTFWTTHGSSVSSVAIKMGNAEFLAPEMRISPLSGRPPSIVKRSNEGSFLNADNPRQSCQIGIQHRFFPRSRLGSQHLEHRQSLIRTDLQQQCTVRLKHLLSLVD